MTAVAIAATPVRARTGWVLPSLLTLLVLAGARIASLFTARRSAQLERARAFAAELIENRWPVCLVLLAAFAVVVGTATLDPYPIGAAVDDAMYVVLGKSLATGQGFRSLNLPGAPPNTHFPPGYPAVLSLIWRVAPAFPANVVLFKTFNILCLSVVAVGVARFLTRQSVGRGWALGLGIVTVASVPILMLVAMLLSELFFLALLVLLLPALEQFARTELPGRRGVSRAIVLGVAIGACTLVRSHGIVLIPALAIALGARRRWRDIMLFVGAALLCIVPWQLWCTKYAGTLPAPLLGAYDSYTAWWARGLHEMGWGMVPRILERTLAEAGDMFGALFSPLRGSAGHVLTLVALGLLAIAGIVASWRRIPVTLLFLGGYLAIVAIWPFQPGRFIWGVWPLLLMLLLLGGRAALDTQARWPSSVRVAVAVAFCWTAWGYAEYEARAIRGRWWSSIPRTAAAHIAFAVEWTLGNTAPNDVVSTEDEGPVFLYTGRRTVPVRAFTAAQYLEDTSAASDAAEGLIPVLRQYPARAVIVYSRAGHDIARFLSEQPNPRLALRAEFPGGSAYTVLHR